MFGILLRILAFLFLLWLIRRVLASLLGGAQPQPRSGAAEAKQPPKLTNDTVKDPVCGMYMDPRLAVRVQNRNGAFYFCSDECRNKFLSNPL